MPPKKVVSKAKKVAPPPKDIKKPTAASKSGSTKKKSFKDQHPHLFPKTSKDFRIGRDLQPKRDLSRFVRWPRYIRIQRQRTILKKRLKIPPPINHFSNTLDKNSASLLFKLLFHYRPETPEQKKKRLTNMAKSEVKGEGKTDASKKPKVLKFGLNHVTTLVEQKKAKLVVIAHDVDPIELVVWLPALCRRMDVPYCIVKSKARLGHLVHQKTATVVALTEVRKEHQADLDQLVGNFRLSYNDNVADRRKWGGGIMGVKAQAVQRLRQKQEIKEASKQPRV